MGVPYMQSFHDSKVMKILLIEETYYYDHCKNILIFDEFLHEVG
jgi:hypothetical protein